VARERYAYVNWNGGVCRVFEYPSQKLVSESASFDNATGAARRLGYHVRVFNLYSSDVLPPDDVAGLPARCRLTSDDG
jgi:hypothetical protein